jgi:hypothetical protein
MLKKPEKHRFPDPIHNPVRLRASGRYEFVPPAFPHGTVDEKIPCFERHCW